MRIYADRVPCWLLGTGTRSTYVSRRPRRSRAVLTSENIDAGRTHRLDEFIDRIPDANPLKESLRKLEDLASYATAFRYATGAGRIPASPKADETERLVDLSQTALEKACEAFGVDLVAESPARFAGPHRGSALQASDDPPSPKEL